MIVLCITNLYKPCKIPADHCFIHNKGFIGPHSYCVRPALCVEHSRVDRAKPALGTGGGEHPTVLGVELNGPILSEPSRTASNNTYAQRMHQILTHMLCVCIKF
jgi:hypothetical protein